jgi:hypothetical protein
VNFPVNPDYHNIEHPDSWRLTDTATQLTTITPALVSLSLSGSFTDTPSATRILK